LLTSSNTDKPPYAATVAREIHANDQIPPGAGGRLKVQISFCYSDGFGREIQKKIQAEPSLVNGVQKTSGGSRAAEQFSIIRASQ
jgi:hypothetical protein